ncbi:hypothetical protein F0562_034394 [Nyssa sinensis]|uniref:ENTH domain-containing protein n=1 Tax=Nyssa sinensis TaxID=561372 RepID=A0A5J5AK18_9ASTE|nr:hypothetical protein F0562_034394 [Nyssa sinensis]
MVVKRRFRQVFTSLKEHSRVSYAKIATIGGFCDLDLIVVKATSPDDLPLPDRYVHELLKIFSVSASSFRAFSLSFTRRFGKTHCWRVALKCLVLLHRLLRSLPDDSPFRSEILWTRSNGLLSLYPCHFLDDSSSASEDYTMFIRSYARLLDEVLDCLSIESKEAEEDEVLESLPDKMKEVGRMLEVLPQLQSIIDRVMDCRPTGASTRSFLVQSATKHIIRDSFICYTTFRKEIVMILDNLFQIPYRSSIAAFGIYKKAALQANQLSEFYDWCKFAGLCGSYEYPFIDRIPQIQVYALENFLNGMWQLTESSSSPASLLTSTMESPLSSTEDDSDKQLVIWEKVEENAFPRKLVKDEEEEPLLQWDVVDNGNWEDLLEASIGPCKASRNNLFYHSNGYGNNMGEYGQGEEANGWQMQLYNPYASNPFYQPQT